MYCQCTPDRRDSRSREDPKVGDPAGSEARKATCSNAEGSQMSLHAMLHINGNALGFRLLKNRHAERGGG